MKFPQTLLLVALSFAPLGAGAVHAQPIDALRDERLVSVLGEGKITARPDMALITLGVVSEAKSARDALTANNEAMSKILAALKGEGLEERDLQTSGFFVEPRYSQPPPGFDGSQPFEPEIVGYAVRNQLTLRIRKIADVGRLLDRAITLGANSVSGPTFTVADPGPLQDEARRAAVRDALRKGRLYADAASVRLGPIARIEESAGPRPLPAPMMAMAKEAADASVPIEGGELTFEAQVAVSWVLTD
jgi:uncharacterized protein YggE